MMSSMADSQPPVQVLGAPHPLFYATADRRHILINNIHGYANYNNYVSWSNVANNSSNSNSNSDSELANKIGCAGALSFGPLRPLGIDHTQTNTNNSTSTGTSSGRRADQLMQRHSLRSCKEDMDVAEEASSSDNTSHHRHHHHNKQRGDERNGDEFGSWLQLGLATQPDCQSTTVMSRMRPSSSYAAGFNHLDLHLATPPAANNNHNHATAIPAFLSASPSLHHHHHNQTTLLSAGAPSLPVSPSSSSSLMQSWPAGPTTDFRIIHPPPRRPHCGLWFMLQASQHQGREPFLPQLSKSFLRIRDGRMTVRLVMKYVAKKLGLDAESECHSIFLMITCIMFAILHASYPSALDACYLLLVLYAIAQNAPCH
ncbi:hypothetical protein Cgig2_028540 [Carnegiea gigantea]|uniref:Uncharacterized protein n=1 Tax=Carnegiea gigantea TaxID=171969 RepID=A0A9Q1JWD0_9CARY|nr:hypothetical protein Cgig2_028540 [Carnegiea gigantea]